MKCKKCGGEWMVSPEMERKVIACPFCNGPLEQKNRAMNTMEDVIRAMREDFGLESLGKKNMLLGSFMDLAPHMKREQQMLRVLAELDGHMTLIRALSLTQAEQRTEVEKLVQQMHEQRFVDEGIARRICVTFFHGIGGITMEKKDTVDTPTEAAKQQTATSRKCATPEGSKRSKGGASSSSEGNAEYWLYYNSAILGDVEAQYKLGKCFEEGLEGVKRDAFEAFKWYHMAAEYGYAAAQYKTGEAFFWGRGATQNRKEAVKWYRKAADKGYAAAQYTLGLCAFNGWGMPQKVLLGMTWMRKAAEQGYALASYQLGCWYHFGNGIEADKDEASKWYRKAIQRGEADVKSKAERRLKELAKL